MIRTFPILVEESRAVPSTAELLTSGGDRRIACDSGRGVNKYGCPPVPDPAILAYGSSTASIISPEGFAAADALREQLVAASAFEAPATTYAREMDRVRDELKELCELQGVPGLEIIFAASGTDLHLIAAQLAAHETKSPALAVMVEAAEQGTGVPAALAGRHFSDCTAFGKKVVAGESLANGFAPEVASIPSRAADGSPRALAEIDADFERIVSQAAAAGRRVLLISVDTSKTGLIAPSPACATALKHRFPATVEVMVDACQFRLAPATLRAYLEHGFMVAITGSKFVTGPTFCGALLVPSSEATRFRARALTPALGAYSARADWPRGWAANGTLAARANYGLLLRWEAALAELRAFRSLPELQVAAFLKSFASAIGERLSTDPAFEALPVPKLERRLFRNLETWDRTQTIFPFLLRRVGAQGRKQLDRDETARVYQLLGQALDDIPGTYALTKSCGMETQRCRVGQPVACGVRAGMPVSALRLCASARLVVDALSPRGRGAQAVIAEALSVLDKAALIASSDLI